MRGVKKAAGRKKNKAAVTTVPGPRFRQKNFLNVGSTGAAFDKRSALRCAASGRSSRWAHGKHEQCYDGPSNSTGENADLT